MHVRRPSSDRITLGLKPSIQVSEIPRIGSTSTIGDITDSPCIAGNCSQVANPIFTRQGLHTWWYRLYGSVRVFDLDVIDNLLQPDSDYFIDVPRQVGAFEIFQQGANIAADSFGPLEPYPDVANSRLAPIHATGTASFVPVAGHRYAVAGTINVQSRDGADVDAGHTLSLEHITLSPGLVLSSAVSTNAAHFYRLRVE